MMVGYAKLADVLFTLALSGLERVNVVNKVREMEEAGNTPDQITDALQKMAADTEAAARKRIDGV